MTRDGSFKRAVRRYAESTNRTYTQALASMRNDEFEARFKSTGTATLPAHLEARYGIAVEGIASLEPHGEGVIGVDRSDGPSWVARVFPKRPIERAEGDVRVLRFLAEQGFPAERLAHSEPVSVHEGQPVVVTEFVEGQPLFADDRGQPFKQGACAELLGRLHALSVPSDMREGGAMGWGGHFGRPSRELADCRHMLSLVPKDITARHQPVYDQLCAIIDRADGCDGLPEAVTHPNLWPGEVIVTPAGDRVVIDWTESGRGPRLSGLAAGLSHPVHAPGDTWFNDEVIEAIVAGYTQHVRLEPDELKRLGAAILVRAAFYACWHYRWLGAGSPTPWDQPAHEARDITAGMAGHMPSEELAHAIAGKVRRLL